MRISDYPRAAALARVAVKPTQNKKPAVTSNQANTGKPKDISMATSASLDFPNASTLTPRMGG